MFKFKYKNAEGNVVELGQQQPFLITSKEGLDAVDNDITSSTQFNLAGASLVGQRLAVREIVLKGTMVASDQNSMQDLRTSLISAFNPTLAGSLEYEVEDKTYSIDVLVGLAPSFGTTQGNLTLDFTIKLTALDPYWYDVTDYNKLIPLSSIQNQMRFPMAITSKYIFASIVSGAITTVTNTGDIDTGAVYTLSFNGDAQNVKILNIATGDFFKINDSFVAGDKVILNTVRGNLSLTKTNSDGAVSNLMSKRDANSTFFELIKGDNFIQITADSGETSIVTNMQFTPLVLGV